MHRTHITSTCNHRLFDSGEQGELNGIIATHRHTTFAQPQAASTFKVEDQAV
jgi:hypothetical protein